MRNRWPKCYFFGSSKLLFFYSEPIYTQINLVRVFLGIIRGPEPKFGIAFLLMCILFERYPFLFGKFCRGVCLFSNFNKNALEMQKLEDWYKCNSGLKISKNHNI